ncbi:MAG: hypothetical protein JSV09_10955 [Thermoplasmata archaeon]|nr:MAG: hypothetical protein JSV09_10955 [Thermoplasmata archaeon]
MATRVMETTSSIKDKESETSEQQEIGAERRVKNGGTVSESFFLGEITTVPLIYLEGEMQQREFHKPGLSMEPINFLEENDPAVIKKYLCGFMDLPTNLLNVGSAINGMESVCIDLGSRKPSIEADTDTKKAAWSVSEVKVCCPKMVFGCNGEDRKIEPSYEDIGAYETPAETQDMEGPDSSMDDILDEFSMELEKKIIETGYTSGVLLDEDHLQRTGFWTPKAKPKEIQEEEKPKPVDEPEVALEQDTKMPSPMSQPEDIPVAEDVSLDEASESKVELDVEVEGPQDMDVAGPQDVEVVEPHGEEVAGSHDMEVVEPQDEEVVGPQDMEVAEPQNVEVTEPQDIEVEGTAKSEDEPELEDTIDGILELMDELENEKKGTEEERAKLREMVNEIQEKRGDFGKDFKGTEEDKIELMDMVRAVEDKMNDLKMEKMDTELDKAEMEGMIAGMEDKITDLEISQIGAEAEETELKRKMDGIEKKILELDEKKDSEEAKTEMEDALKGMESKMAEMETKIQGAEEKMEELKDEMDVRTFTADYIQNIDDVGELRALAVEVGLESSGSLPELKERLLGYVEGIEEESEEQGEEDPRFTKENIENIQTKAELVALCVEANLKKSGRKEEIRKRLLEYVESKELEAQKEKIKGQRFTKEHIEGIKTKDELLALCEEANLPKSGKKEELRKRLLEYASNQEMDDKTLKIGMEHEFRLESTDKLALAVLGDMYKHLSLELGDHFQEHMNDLNGFIRTILEVREELGLESDEILKSVAIKPKNDKTAEILNNLKLSFLTKVKADSLEVVEPDKEWEGIKLQMDMDKENITATYTTQAAKIQMLLRLQPPELIKKVLEEKGEYTLGVEGYPITIVPDMLSFRVVTPENFEIKETEGGMVYIEKETIRRAEPESEDILESEEDDATSEQESPEGIPDSSESQKSEDTERFKRKRERSLPPPPSGKPRKTILLKSKKSTLFGKIKKRLKK